jgi:proline iminopeptidase
VRLSDGAELWTRAGGTGPPMVLVHGGPGMWDYLEPVAELAPFRTHRYDQRGCGRSSPSSDYGLDRSVADLEELRSGLGYERWWVFGHSFGAALGLEYAAAHPDRVLGLVYCSGQGLDWPRHRLAYHRAAADRRTAAENARLTDLAAKDRTWAEEVEWRRLSWLPDFADPAHARVDAETPLPLNLDCHRALNDELRERPVPLPDVPTWVVHGSLDPRPAEGPRALAAALPRATHRELDGAGHQPWRERPDLLRALFSQLRTREWQ